MTLCQADALHMPLADSSVDCIVTSPPYFALRDYQDGDVSVVDQLGLEEHPYQFLDALEAWTIECLRVMKPGASLFVNLGDKRSGSGGHNNASLSKAGSTLDGTRQQDRVGPPLASRGTESIPPIDTGR